MFAARIDAIIRPSAPGNSSCRQAKPNAFSGSPSSAASACPCATIAATISPTSAQPTVQTRLTKLPKNIPMRQVRSSLPVPTVASWCGCAMMPTRPLIVSIAITHGPMPDGVASEKRNGSSDAFIPSSPPTTLQPSGISMNESDDDQEALEQIGPGRRDQPADEAVEDEHHRHRDDDLVDADAAAGRLADHLAGALEHAAGVDDEEAQRKHDVDRAHPRSRTDPR